MTSRPTIFANPKSALAQAQSLLASDPARGVQQVRNLLSGLPDDPVLLRMLASGLRRLGQDEEAEKAELEAIAASTRSPMHREAAIAVRSGNRGRAMTLLKGLLARDNHDVVALVMLGLQHVAAGEFKLAEPLLDLAVKLAPADPSARMALAELYQKTKQPVKALEHLDALKEEARQAEPALALRAAALGLLGRQEEEVAILRRLIEDGQTVRYRIRLGHALRALGETEEAIATYRGIIEESPGNGTAWWSLANLKTVRFSDKDIRTMELALKSTSAPIENRVRLNFALGKANEDRGNAEAAFRHYDEGNRLRRTISRFDPGATSMWVDGSIKLFSPEFFAKRAGQGSQTADPIFIVGMQRSGSTLVEQILASHPMIEGTAELTEMPTMIRELGDAAAKRDWSFERYMALLKPDQLKTLGEAYIDRTRIHRREDKPLFTDKMPNNWMHVGLIRTILPNARIVDVRRNPMACSFSNWKQLYAKGLDHSNSLDTMGQFYADYVRLMRHFDKVQPGAVHRIIYERLVDDVEGETRRLLDYLGIPFDPACLEFHSSDRAVRTISAEQVRRPINREGVDQWKAFEEWLDPLKEGLGSALEDWDKA